MKVNKYRESRVLGFTLIELMVVISIVAMLASTVLAATSRVRFQSKIAVMKKEFQQLGLATQLYHDNNGYRWGGGVQHVLNTCPTTGTTMFADAEVSKVLTAISRIFPGSTLECLATQDHTMPFTTAPAKYWTVYLRVPGYSGSGENRWCMDNYSGLNISWNGPGVSSVTMLVTTPIVTRCAAYSTSPDW